MRLTLDLDERQDVLANYQEGGHLQHKTWQLANCQERIWLIMTSKFCLFSQLFAFLIDMYIVWSYGFQERPDYIWLITLVTTCAYVLDLTLRAYFFGLWVFVSRVWRRHDLIVIYIVLLGTLARIPWASNFRILTVGHIARMFFTEFRYITGENKSRFISPADDLDLDLSYVTPRCIAMSVPAGGFLTRIYRNDIADVRRFFALYHRSHFHIINLCPEVPYNYTMFGMNSRTGRNSNVSAFNIQDHTPPLMDDFVEFFSIARHWMNENDNNTMAVHCRGGKGRTGSVVCAWLLYNGEAEHAQDALNIFALARTDLDHHGFVKIQGVETPSQVRYVKYIHQYLDEGPYGFPDRVPAPPAVWLKLHKVVVNDMFMDLHENKLVVAVHRARKADELTEGHQKWHIIQWSNVVEPAAYMEFSLGNILVSEDVRISVFAAAKKDTVTASELAGKHVLAGVETGCKFFFLFHTYFHRNDESLEIPTTEMDKAFKDVNKKYKEEGSMTVHFTRLWTVNGRDSEHMQHMQLAPSSPSSRGSWGPGSPKEKERGPANWV